MKKFLVVLLAGSLLFANSAFAGRFGGGRSSGMQRGSMAAPSYRSNYGNSNRSPEAAHGPTGGAQQQRSGMGAGNAAMLGAAAGAAGGYMLGKSSGNNANNVTEANASGAVAARTNEARNSIPWGTIIILVAILGLGLMFFRKKINPGLSSGNPMNNFNSQNSNNFNMPNMNRTPNNVPTNKPIIKFGSAAPAAPEQLDKMPDGVETIYFLRQAKGMFLHIQSMNSGDNLSEIQKYMTPQLFAEIQEDIAKNQTVADFTNLDCQLMQCEAIAASQTEDGQTVEAHLVASVRFLGNVSETPEQPPLPFSEVWNFVKSESTNNKWVVAGIQQDNAPTQK
ncbi:MAG: Tim44 protein [Burkholderiales bacterium]|nr:Tim44 protein [Burkholderiales bacterium]